MPVDDVHAEYKGILPDWKVCEDCYAGERVIKAAGREYLPFSKDEEETVYKSYLKRALFYGAFRRTVNGLVGSAFRKPWEIEIVSSGGGEDDFFNNIDGAGSSLNAQARVVLRNILTTGREGLWADLSNSTKQPLLVRWSARDIRNWHIDDGKLSWVVLRTWREDFSDDKFSPDKKKRYLHLHLPNGTYTIDIWEETDGDNTDAEFTLVKTITPVDYRSDPITVIPFVFINTTDLLSSVQSPLLLDLAFTNLDHYRLDASLKNGLFAKGIPIAYFFHTGLENKEAVGNKVMISGAQGIASSNADASAGYMEVEHGFDSISDAQIRDELRMAALGSRILEEQRTEAEAALAIQYRTSSETSLLASVINNVVDAYNSALAITETLYGIGVVKVKGNMDFLGTRLSANDINALVAAWQSGAIDTELLVHNYRLGELLPEDDSNEDIIKRIGSFTQPQGENDG